MYGLLLNKINKIYPNGVQAVFDFTLDIKDGEFIVLVGPSGCGKSTTLRMIAGLEGITSGDLILNNERINSIAAGDRDIAMVFQNYALYPHMTVYDNMGISLKIKHEHPVLIHDNVKEKAQNLGLTDFLNRLPANLSGGQRQRVALGRTIVRSPKVFLMDEPLSNLDAKLREKTRTEIVKLQKEYKTTTIYVTHDQIEAMTMADRIVIMKDGYIKQIGTPYDVYTYPDNLFVAGFIGSPNMNFIKGYIKDNYFVHKDIKIKIPEDKYRVLTNYQNHEVILGIRPEHISSSEDKLAQNESSTFTLDINHHEFLGKEYYLDLNLFSQSIVARVSSQTDISSNKVKVCLDMQQSHFFDIETEKRIVREDS